VIFLSDFTHEENIWAGAIFKKPYQPMDVMCLKDFAIKGVLNEN
jgi:hypothetical protein